MICISEYFTDKIKIEILSNKTVKLTSNKEDEKVYLLDAQRLYDLFKKGGKQWKIPTGTGGYEQISFNVPRKHISNAGSQINTYIAQHDYEMLLVDLEALLELRQENINEQEI